MSTSNYTAEFVAIPAVLLRDLIWAVETLTGIEPDKDDAAMINDARRLLFEQAPQMHSAMLEVDALVIDGDPA